MRRNRLQEEWNRYAEAVLPGNCSAIQRQEMRRSFYAGAHVLFEVLTNHVSSGEGEPTVEDLQMMKDVNDEIIEFAKAVREGRA